MLDLTYLPLLQTKPSPAPPPPRAEEVGRVRRRLRPGLPRQREDGGGGRAGETGTENRLKFNF